MEEGRGGEREVEFAAFTFSAGFSGILLAALPSTPGGTRPGVAHLHTLHASF